MQRLTFAKLRRFGNPDDVFAQTRPKTGLITQAEVRAVALAQLDLHSGDVFWDVGAGSGSVAIEAAALVAIGSAIRGAVSLVTTATGDARRAAGLGPPEPVLGAR